MKYVLLGLHRNPGHLISLNETGFLLPNTGSFEIFEIEKYLADFVFGGANSLNSLLLFI